MADPTISHGWVTAEPDAGKDVDADNLNDHVITGFNAAVDARVATEAALARNADNLSSGTVADVRIAGTIARDSEVTSAVSTHAGATDPHGDRADAASQVATHSADTTAVHGIADTAAVVLTGDARLSDARTPTAHKTSHEDGGADEISLTGLSGTPAALTTHEAAADPHPGYVTPAEGAVSYDAAGAAATAASGAASALSAHEADTTSVHGITNTANLLVSGGALGTPSSGTATNLTGTASGLTAGTVTTNANLTGDVTSSGNATTIGSGKVTEAMQVLADNTTQDVSTTKHGYAPKGDGVTTKFLNANGAYSTPAGGGISSGTSNPGSPTNGDLFYRSDLDLLIRYRSSGTRWVCTCLHTSPMQLQNTLLPFGSTGSLYTGLDTTSFGLFVERVSISTLVPSGNNSGGNFWTLAMANVTLGSSVSTAGDNNTGTRHDITGGTIAQGNVYAELSFTKSGTAGNLYVFAGGIVYRYIVT